MKNMLSNRFVSFLVASLWVLLVGGVTTLRADSLVVTAARLAKAPAGLDDPSWQRVPVAEIPVKGHASFAEQEFMVQTRAAYTRNELYFRFQWHDPTYSVSKQAWVFDGEKWNHLKGNEDRIALLFEITRINKFATRGCAIVCHSPPDAAQEEWKLATRTASEIGDLWHWKAARSAPYGYADDAWLTVAGKPSGAYRKTGRRKDVGAGGDVKNQAADGSRPQYMQNPAGKASAPGFLLFEEAVPIPDGTVFKVGDTIPYRLPLTPNGSRFDVKAESRYRDGTWTVMLSRKLDTGQDDDVVFDPARRYSFAMAVFDDSGSEHSKATEALSLRFAH